MILPSVLSLSHPLSTFTTLGLGGPARDFVCARDEASLIAGVHEADLARVEVLVLGGGSNLVVSDGGFEGRVVHVQTRGITYESVGDEVTVTAAAGEPWDGLVGRCVEAGLAGIECLSGIPGSVGGTPIQNVGAYGQELSDTLDSVRLYDREEHTTLRLGARACGLSYRDSVFKREARGRYVVLSVSLKLRPGGESVIRYAELSRAMALADAIGWTKDLAAVRGAVISLRRAKSMVIDASDPESRSAGSFFMNPVVSGERFSELEARLGEVGIALSEMPRYAVKGGFVKLSAGWLIERAGIARGTTFGGVGVSKNHALALVNRGGTAEELVALARHIRQRVQERFGVDLFPEPVFAGFSEDDPTG